LYLDKAHLCSDNVQANAHNNYRHFPANATTVVFCLLSRTLLVFLLRQVGVTYLHARFLFTRHFSASVVPRHFYEIKRNPCVWHSNTEIFHRFGETEIYFRWGPIWPDRVLEIYLAGIRIITLAVETKEYSNKTCRNSLSAAVSRIYIDTRAVTVNTASDLPLPKNLRQFLSSKLSFLRTTLTLPSNILLGVQNRSFERCFPINILYSFAWFIPATCPAHGNKVIKIADLLDI
jgi:hypothetical protein